VSERASERVVRGRERKSDRDSEAVKRDRAVRLVVGATVYLERKKGREG
jgi:hypothetical protein